VNSPTSPIPAEIVDDDPNAMQVDSIGTTLVDNVDTCKTVIVDEPKKIDVILPVIPQIPKRNIPDEDLQPYTDEELKSFSLEERRMIICDRAAAIRQQSAQKRLIVDLLHLQKDAFRDETGEQKEIDKIDRRIRNIVNGNGGNVKRIESEPALQHNNKNSPLEVDDESTDSDDDESAEDENESDNSKAVMERPKERPEGSSTLKHTTSEPQRGVKRAASEALAPTGKIDIEPPKKKAKSLSGEPVPKKKATTPKKALKCDECGFPEPKLWSTDARDKKKYCFRCHTTKFNRCSHKPKNGGRACFNTKEEGSEKCSKHQFTNQMAELPN